MTVNRQRAWVSNAIAGSSITAWFLANGLDILSVLYGLQFGGSWSFLRYHPAESFLIYAGLRLLGTLAIVLLVVWITKRWASVFRAAWGGLTVCALTTAIAAWWRLYR
jgi:hypothetical protein